MKRDEHYFLMRAEQEEAKAAAASNEEARNCHLDMAKVYRETAIMQQSRTLAECRLGVPPPAIS